MPALSFQVGQTVLFIRHGEYPPVEQVKILELDLNYAWKGELLDSGYTLAKTVETIRPYPIIPPEATEEEKQIILENAMNAAELDGDTPGGVHQSYEPGALVISLTRRLQSNEPGNKWKAEILRLTSPDNSYFKIQRPNGETQYVSRYNLKPLPAAQAPPSTRATGGGRRHKQRRTMKKPRKSRRASKKRHIRK
jgi:hypothetical protein